MFNHVRQGIIANSHFMSSLVGSTRSQNCRALNDHFTSLLGQKKLLIELAMSTEDIDKMIEKCVKEMNENEASPE